MDNKEAAEVIAAIKKHEIDILKINAFELAIKALEQEPDAIHNEREQAYMKGYEDASKRYRTEPCEDAISRSEAIRIASGYCHWTNIPDELAKLPSVNPKPCGDAISRQAAIDAMREETCGCCWDAKDILKHLPSVSTEKTGRWIAVSEKLPEENEYIRDTARYYLVQNEYGDMMVARYTHSGYWEQIYQLKPIGDQIVAWMPLPQPYKAESEENNG